MSMFWGLLLILIGLSLVIKVVFNIDFPVFKIVFAFFLIYMGIKIITGNFNFHNFKSGNNDVVFGEKTFKEPFVDGQELNVVFSKGTVDLRNVMLSDSSPLHLKLNTVFSGTEVLLDSTTPIRITTEGAFSGVTFPNGNTSSFGKNNFDANSPDSQKGYIDLSANVVFGGLQVKQY